MTAQDLLDGTMVELEAQLQQFSVDFGVTLPWILTRDAYNQRLDVGFQVVVVLDSVGENSIYAGRVLGTISGWYRVRQIKQLRANDREIVAFASSD